MKRIVLESRTTIEWYSDNTFVVVVDWPDMQNPNPTTTRSRFIGELSKQQVRDEVKPGGGIRIALELMEHKQ